jgi:sulfatase-like protein
MSPVQIARRLGIDAAVWYVAPVLFLLLYVYGFAAPSLAIRPHLLIVSLPFAAFALVRLALVQFLRPHALARVAVAVVGASLFACLLLYYAFVLVGLRSWGGVVAWNVIPTFFQQAPEFADVLGFPPILVLLLFALIIAGLVAACWWYFARFDWATAVTARISGLTVAVLVIAGIGILATQVYRFWSDPWIRASEPVSLTLFPMAEAHDLEGHALDPNAARTLDQLEDAARAAYVPATAVPHRNVILIIVDALRPDHMGIYGYARDTTPNLNRLAQARLVRPVTGMHASCGDTICGLLAISTSKVPRKFSFRPFSLQEVLRSNGYRVHMILSGDHTNFYTLKRQYGPVDSFFDGTQAKGYFINDDQFLIDRVKSMPEWDGKPTLFQFHVMSSHVLRKKEDEPGPWQPAVRYLFHDVSIIKDTGPRSVQVETTTNFYDNGVHKTDSVIHELLDALESKGFLRDALVVITADHGEGLGEHGMFLHANSLREELLRIPFILVSYGYEPQRPIAARPFSVQIDIGPTILSEVGVPMPQTWMGHPLQEPLSGGFAYLEERTLTGLIDYRDPQNIWKYWIDTKTGEERAFNLTHDPHENENVLGQTAPVLLGEWRVHARTGSPLTATRD